MALWSVYFYFCNNAISEQLESFPFPKKNYLLPSAFFLKMTSPLPSPKGLSAVYRNGRDLCNGSMLEEVVWGQSGIIPSYALLKTLLTLLSRAHWELPLLAQ